jgi:hypothetical protein
MASLSRPSVHATNLLSELRRQHGHLFRPESAEANWMATPAGRGYFVIVRLCGPTEAAINKS